MSQSQPQQSNKENQMPESLEYHRTVLESHVQEGKYVISPPIHAPVAELPNQGGAGDQLLDSTADGKIANPKLLHNRMQQTYISPSDTIMSPATQKLAAFKNKHMGKG
jgi:Spo12 family protein